MQTLPLFHNLAGSNCLLVGAGIVALRKLRLLLSANARVKVVALQACSEIEQLAGEGKIELILRSYRPEDIDGSVLVVAATNNSTLNQQLSSQAKSKCIAVNVVDNPGYSSVIFPSIVDRSPVQIAIGTNGCAPVLARQLRTRLETLLPGGTGMLAELAGQNREKIKREIPNELKRKKFWEQVFEGPIAELVYSGRKTEAEALLHQQLKEVSTKAIGEVYLVGGGPGDPDLLTFRAVRLMQQADIVLYDRLISDEVLDMVRRDADRIYVGKKAGEHTVSQENINEKLVEFALSGKRVLRLKGGDPFIFGRGGEEIQHLAERGVPFQVVPGITAASGCASYAGIPLTHRDYAQSVQFQTGHRRGGGVDLDWKTLVKDKQTLIFYMPINGLHEICSKLVEHGLPSLTPAALIENGTRPSQKVYTGTLSTLPVIIQKENVQTPTLLIVGEVVTLRNKLKWFGEHEQ